MAIVYINGIFEDVSTSKVSDFVTSKILHREDGPSIVWEDGQEEWFFNGYRHREDGPAIIYANGTKTWFINGLKHRLDGPAVERDMGQEWWVDGKNID